MGRCKTNLSEQGYAGATQGGTFQQSVQQLYKCLISEDQCSMEGPVVANEEALHLPYVQKPIQSLIRPSSWMMDTKEEAPEINTI